MVEHASKSFDLGGGGSTVLKFNGYPRHDGIRVDVENGAGNVDINYYVDRNDELDQVTTGTATQVDSVDGVGSGSSDGTDVAARTILVELIEQTTTDPVDGTVYAHNASDPGENVNAFINR